MGFLDKARKQGLPLTIKELIERSARLFADLPALTAREKTGDRTVTYRALFEEVKALASTLISLGLKKGERVAILGPNSPEWAKAYLATIYAGGINVPIDSLLSDNEKGQLMARAGVKIAFVSSRFLDVILDLPRGFPGPSKIVCLDWGERPAQGGIIPVKEAIFGNSSGKSSFPAVEPDDIAAIIFTSGTTGVPKGVMLSNWNITSDCIACSWAVDIDRERFLSVLPMHHTFECTAGFLLPLLCGSHITYARSLKSRYILEDLKACRATVMLGVPLLFQKMQEGIERAMEKAPFSKKVILKGLWKAVLAAEKTGNKNLGKLLFKSVRRKAGLDHIRYFVSGGAPLPYYVPVFFRRLGVDMLQGYGLTETSPVLTINPSEAPRNESVGKPLPGVKVRVLDPGRDGVGELAFKGPMVMKGYLDDEKATRQVLDDDGWLRTGDLGLVDNDGYVHVCGRAKNLIVTAAGKNVYPEEIEAILNKSEFILESMVYGKMSESTGGEDVRAIIVPDFEALGQRQPKAALNDDFLEKIIEREVKKANRALASYKRIKHFDIVNEELPKTSTKKIKRHLFNLNLLRRTAKE